VKIGGSSPSILLTTEIVWEPRLSFPVVTGERPEVTAQDKKSKKAKTRTEKKKRNSKRRKNNEPTHTA
jgi:hypothetical protein